MKKKYNENHNKNKLLKIISLLATSFLVAACENNYIPEFKKVHRAPMSNEEVGVIISGISERTMGDLLKSNPDLKVRVINPSHNLYEVYGANEPVLTNLINDTSIIVEKNSYIDLKYTLSKKTFAKTSTNPFAAAIEKYQRVKLDDAAMDFLKNCIPSNPEKSRFNVLANQGRDKKNTGILFELGQSLKLQATDTAIPKKSTNKFKYMWVFAAPEDSLLEPAKIFTDHAEYNPDTTGAFTYSIVAKDNSNVCSLDIQPFYVTANDVFKPESPLPDSFADRINPETFWHVFHVGSQEGWNTATGTGIVIGIIDTGVDYNHQALSSNIFINNREIPANGIDDDGNGFIDDVTGYDFGLDDPYPFDDFGHGTHVAGIAASNIFGTGRKAKILPTKFGGGLGFDIASVAGAIKYNTDMGANIINMSLGWSQKYAVMQGAMNYAEKKNVLIVVAAGNESSDNDFAPSYPSSYTNNNVISVAATDENDALTEYSNFGQTVHIGAPGGTEQKQIISSYKKNPRQVQYVGFVGTSMASPLVAGVAAQAWSANPNLNAAQLRQLLLDTGKLSSALTGKILSGKVIDAKAAVKKALSTRPESSPLL
ncbi:MAG: hypothetical protein A2Z20_06670 [Bdellovibrionales bacterium RBG_16_40_8]|nr:MAG: hypothetical protein A2Z20_06670 [Bdellovibrionales bacterium RBG_16_40_8]